MFLSKEKKLLFLHNPKTAGTSIRNVLENISKDGKFLRSILYERYVNSPFNNRNHHMQKNSNQLKDIDFLHLSQKQLASLVYDFNLEDFVEITIVRNPYDRLLSYYNFVMHNEYKDIEKFIDDIEQNKVDPSLCYRSQLDYVTDPITKNQKIFKYENIDDLSSFLEVIVGTKVTIPKLNVTRKNTIRNLDPYLKEKCYHILKEEFDQLGYKK